MTHREILRAIFTDPEVWQAVAVLLLMAAAVLGLLLVLSPVYPVKP